MLKYKSEIPEVNEFVENALKNIDSEFDIDYCLEKDIKLSNSEIDSNGRNLLTPEINKISFAIVHGLK